MRELYLCASSEVKTKNENLLSSIKANGFKIKTYSPKASSPEDKVLVLGGDGSLNHFLNLHSDCSRLPHLVYLACGTGNDFSRLFKNREPTFENFLTLYEGKPLDIPIAMCNERYFINVASGGDLARITNPSDDEKKKNWGKLSYYLEGIKATTTLERKKFKITAGKIKKQVEAVGFVIAQGAYAGGGIKVTQSAGLHPYLFECLFFKSDSIFDGLRSFIELQKDFSELDSDQVSFFRSESLTIECDKKDCVKLDGEPYWDTIFKFKHSDETLPFMI
ncbi:MAG: hypothetical protein CME64_16675 [Halobacteriovoraceae bacterium]|nr:hypothetical protein [Halobacteriovoraceae bacterium]|tara:strand:- start:165247 stop:166077 length:831 start_codon:yes stop_codon:yes gene_type:complete